MRMMTSAYACRDNAGIGTSAHDSVDAATASFQGCGSAWWGKLGNDIAHRKSGMVIVTAPEATPS